MDSFPGQNDLWHVKKHNLSFERDRVKNIPNSVREAALVINRLFLRLNEINKAKPVLWKNHFLFFLFVKSSMPTSWLLLCFEDLLTKHCQSKTPLLAMTKNNFYLHFLKSQSAKIWKVVVVDWSSYLPSIPTIQIWILLTSISFFCFIIWKADNKYNASWVGPSNVGTLKHFCINHLVSIHHLKYKTIINYHYRIIL